MTMTCMTTIDNDIQVTGQQLKVSFGDNYIQDNNMDDNSGHCQLVTLTCRMIMYCVISTMTYRNITYNVMK